MRTAVLVVALCAVLVPLSSAQGNARRPAAHDGRFTATAYCQDGKTQSGARTRQGIVAADPKVLPVGTVIRIDQPGPYAGIYTVLDTGARVKGSELDIFMASCVRAVQFGRRTVRVRVLRHGWDPRAEP